MCVCVHKRMAMPWLVTGVCCPTALIFHKLEEQQEGSGQLRTDGRDGIKLIRMQTGGLGWVGGWRWLYECLPEGALNLGRFRQLK